MDRTNRSARRFRFALLSAFVSSAACAATVAPADAVARTAAWLARPGAAVAPSGEVRTFCCGDEMLYHLVGLSCGGYVALAADDTYGGMLGFTTEGEMPPDGCHDTLVWDAIVGSLCSKKPPPSDDDGEEGGDERPPEFTVRATNVVVAAAARPAATNAVASASLLDKVVVAPLVKSRWDQEYVGGKPCFNYFVPSHTLCGCVATAMAQIMRHHCYPTGEVASVTRRCNVFGQDMGLTTSGGPYEWSKMPLVPSAAMSEAERRAIGRLCLDAGIAMESTYTEWWTSANGQTVHEAFRDAFGFADTGAVTINGSEEKLRKALLDSLDAGDPCMVSIYGYLHGHHTGHMVIADGYGWRGGKLYCHLNMGQSGMWDYWTLVETGGRVASLGTVTYCHPR